MKGGPIFESSRNVFLWEEEVRGSHLLPEEGELPRSLRLEDPLQPGYRLPQSVCSSG